MGKLIHESVKVFHIETTVNNRMFDGPLEFLHKNEDDFTDWDRTRLKGFQWTMRNMSSELRRTVLHNYAAPYGVTGVFAGETEAVHQKTLARSSSSTRCR